MFVVHTLVLAGMLMFVLAEVHPCKKHLSSCRNCLEDTENGCVLCAHSNLQQCLSATDPLATFCSTFKGEVLDDVSKCDDEQSLSETCASFSTENNLNCTGCLATEGCGWCAISPGAQGTGSCHAASGSMAQTVCSLLSGGSGVFVTESNRAEEVCPASEVPNYCPTYLLNCDGCSADPDCGICVDFSNADSCQGVERCIPRVNADTDCRNNELLFRGTFLPDLDDATCEGAPTTCAELDAALGITPAPTSGDASTTTAAGGPTTTNSSETTSGDDGSQSDEDDGDTVEVDTLSDDESALLPTPKPSSAARLGAASSTTAAIIVAVTCTLQFSLH
eukprot:TRINITY_DN2810_c0_g1_i1.p1 TRINITY_DN2810_c0_g1~~TRINITY_DN2810_c0_g1_i1.p1  ORF type:complete len:335 (+),score=28.78 TRINITY_DN2810_c0_g1_i1:47-1051(+)